MPLLLIYLFTNSHLIGDENWQANDNESFSFSEVESMDKVFL